MEPPGAQPAPLPCPHPFTLRWACVCPGWKEVVQGQQQPGPLPAPRPAWLPSTPTPSPAEVTAGATEDMPPRRRVPGPLTLTLPSDTTLTSGAHKEALQELVLAPGSCPQGCDLQKAAKRCTERAAQATPPGRRAAPSVQRSGEPSHVWWPVCRPGGLSAGLGHPWPGGVGCATAWLRRGGLVQDSLRSSGVRPPSSAEARAAAAVPGLEGPRREPRSVAPASGLGEGCLQGSPPWQRRPSA